MRPDPIELPHPPQATDEESRKGITRAWRSNSTGGRGWAGCSTPDCFNRPGVNTRGDSWRHSASTPESGRRRSSLRLRPVESNSISTRTPGRSWGDPWRGASYRLGTRRQDSMVEAKPALVDPHRLSVVRRPLTLGNVRGRAGECTACPSGACARPRRCLPSGRQPGGPRRGRAMPRVAMVASDYDRLRSGCWLIGQSHGGPRGANPGGAEGCRSEGSRLEVGRCA